jgi:hypothetical protein
MMTDTEPIDYMLTTVDNPFDPFTQYDEWLAFDIKNGYDSNGMLARIAKVSDDLPLTDQSLAIQNAIDEIVKENVSGMWMKVSKDDLPNS